MSSHDLLQTLEITKRLEHEHFKLQKNFQALKDQLEESHQTLEQIIAHMSDALIFVNFQGKISRTNRAAEVLLGVPQHDLLNALYWDHFSDTLFGFSLHSDLSHPRSDRRIFLTLQEKKELEVTTSIIPEKGILILLRDRTEIQKLEKSLQHQDRLRELGEMAAILAHEIRNPLSGIQGFGELLKRDLESPNHQKMIQAILEGSKTINRLITHVLDYARPLQLHFAPTDLVELIQEVVAYMRLDPNIFSSDLQECSLSLDSQLIKLALMNLLKNALEASSTEIKIKLHKNGKLTLTDNGSGIDEGDLEKLFTPFFTTKSNGTGLGLAEVYKIIQGHGGNIQVTSTPGKGTTFTLNLQKKDGH